jgi:hypothetical protein
MKHILVKTNGEFSVYEGQHETLTLDECNKLINGWIEIVDLAREENELFPDNSMFIVDEEGLVKGLGINVFAAWRTNRIIVGDVILTKGDGGGEIIGFDDSEIERVMSLIKNFENILNSGESNGEK